MIVEGAGGLLVRLDSVGGTLLDLAEALAADVVVVVGGRAGHAQPHRAHGRGTARPRASSRPGWSSAPGRPAPGLAEECNLADLPRVTGVPLLAVIPEGAGSLGDHATFAAAVPGWFTA